MVDHPRGEEETLGCDPIGSEVDVGRTLEDLPERPAATIAVETEFATGDGGAPPSADAITNGSGEATRFVGEVFSTETRQTLPSLPGYETLGELGRGGMGVVYSARQARLNRPCALKMILAGEYASAESSVRFLAEAETLARLRHPNIVQVYHVGDHEGRLYLELEYVDGGNLAERLDGTPWLPRRAASLAEALARGTSEAHRLGIVHRDLKPANILMATDGTPKIADFGLAKSLASDTGLTRTESILGSPSYMAPEQADGRTKDVGTAADVYSLGAILYELLTGRPPFKGASILDTLDLVKHAEPVPPSRLVPALPRDIETVVLKCLAKDPSRRYATAGELAEDLRLFLANEPIRGRRAGLAERTWRRCRRNPVVAGLTAAIGLLVAVLAVGSVVYAFQQKRLAAELTTLAADRSAFARRKVVENEETSASLYRALLGRSAAVRLARAPGYRREVWKDLHEAAALDTPAKDLKAIGAEVLACMGDPIGLEPIVPRDAPPRVSTPPENSPRLHLEASITGPSMMISLTDEDGRTSARQLPPVLNGLLHLMFTPDRTKLVAGCGGGLVVWSVPDLIPWAIWRGDQVNAIAVHPSSRMVAAMNNSAQVDLWSLVSNRLVVTFRTPSGTASIAFSADGKALLALSNEGKTLIGWPIRDTPERFTLLGHSAGVKVVAFSPDGRHLASVSDDFGVRVWETRTGRLEATFTEHKLAVHGVTFSPDGAFLATADHQEVLLREFPSGKLRSRKALPQDSEGLWHLQFDPRGKYLLAKERGRLDYWAFQPSSGPDPLGSVLSVSTPGSESLAIHPSGVDVVVPNPSANGEGLRYNLARDRLSRLPLAASHLPFLGLSFDPSGERLYYLGRDQNIGVWDWEKQTNLAPIPTGASGLTGITVSGDGRWIAAQVAAGPLKLFTLPDGREQLALPAESSPALCYAGSPDGAQLAVGLADGRVSLWNLEPIRARLAEFGIVVPSTAARKFTSPPSWSGPGSDVDRVIRTRSEKSALDARATEAAMSGRWHEAASAHDRLIEFDPNRLDYWFHGTIAWARSGDRDGYRRIRHGMLERFSTMSNPTVAEPTAKACLLLPLPGPDFDVAQRLAARSATGIAPENPYPEFAQALAHYRGGRNARSLASVDKSLAHGSLTPNCEIQAHCVRAMTLRRLGRDDEARSALAKASKMALRPVGADWHDFAAADILLREAEAAILDPGFPADPFAR